MCCSNTQSLTIIPTVSTIKCEIYLGVVLSCDGFKGVHLGIAQLCGVNGEACWIVHNGEPIQTDQMFLGQGDVVMFWQKDDHELAGSTVTPGIARALRGR